jgi:hypothetical protein
MIVLVSKFDIYVFITITAVRLLVPEGIIPPSASSLAGFIKYIFYRNLQFLNHVIIIKTQVLLPHI